MVCPKVKFFPVGMVLLSSSPRFLGFNVGAVSPVRAESDTSVLDGSVVLSSFPASCVGVVSILVSSGLFMLLIIMLMRVGGELSLLGVILLSA